eukprot:Nk52_evm71s2657 gene=Nk52_evmTU71s2657
MEVVPKDQRQLRACLLCSLVKNAVQFETHGCDNCGRILGMKGDRDRVLECTSSNFDGCIALTRPDESWVAKWQRIDKFTKGCYAISVTGRLPPDVVDLLENKGIRYMSRDRRKNI